QDHSKHQMAGMKHGAEMSDRRLPKQGGQSAFAAIQEIVTMLEANPKTDWSKVDIEALRQHLIDMNNVTLDATVSSASTDNSMTFIVAGEGKVIGSIQRMITGHAATVNGFEGWTYAAKENATGADLMVTPPNRKEMVKLRALSLIGVLAQGMHHQQHHWMLANGMQPHK
ncbi:MAG: hypothetical protein KGO94_11145, partial [Alphaproteobacteria bacterium]|nr:hypothetical protein [Alphaproteobacteria bacterium]